jgi:PAS domain-containing protein
VGRLKNEFRPLAKAARLANGAATPAANGQRRQKYFEALLEVSPTAIATVDLEDNVTSWNPAAESSSATRRLKRSDGTSTSSWPNPTGSAARDLRRATRKSTST